MWLGDQFNSRHLSHPYPWHDLQIWSRFHYRFRHYNLQACYWNEKTLTYRGILNDPATSITSTCTRYSKLSCLIHIHTRCTVNTAAAAPVHVHIWGNKGVWRSFAACKGIPCLSLHVINSITGSPPPLFLWASTHFCVFLPHPVLSSCRRSSTEHRS